MKNYITVLIIIVFMMSGCSKDKDTSEKLAEVNGQEITQAEFDAFLKFKRIKTDNESKQKKLLDQYLEREALAGVIETENHLDNMLMKAELNEFRKEMLISRYFEQFLNESVSDQAVQNYYNTHAAEYEMKKAHAAHILIRTNSKMSEVERKAVLTTAHEAYSKIRSGEDFASIAKDYSDDKVSSKKGGDLGWMKKGSVSPKFSETIFSLKKDDVSEPFETPFGYHIVKVLDEPKTIKQPFSAVEGKIRHMLRSQTKDAEMERLLGKIEIKK